MMEPGMHVQPSPMSAGSAVADGPSGTMVVLRMETVIGTLMFLLEGDAAISIGEGLIGNGKQAKTGLIIPQNGHVPLP